MCSSIENSHLIIEASHVFYFGSFTDFRSLKLPTKWKLRRTIRSKLLFEASFLVFAYTLIKLLKTLEVSQVVLINMMIIMMIIMKFVKVDDDNDDDDDANMMLMATTMMI